MPDLVRTFLASQYVNTLHSKEELLDIEDDVDNIDTFVREPPYDKLCSPTTPINDSELTSHQNRRNRGVSLEN